MAMGQRGIIFFMITLLKIRMITTAIASSPVCDMETFTFLDSDIKAEMVLLSWDNFLRSLLHFIMVRSDNNELLKRISLPHSSLAKRRKTPERWRFSTLPAWMLIIICWTSILRPFVERLPMWSSIRQSIIHVWFWDMELFTAWVKLRWNLVSRYL